MKKIILIPLFVVLFLSCQKKPDEIKVSAKAKKESPTEASSTSNAKMACSDYLLVIDKSKLQPDWLILNSKYLCGEVTVDGDWILDLYKISSELSSETIANWMKQNNYPIDYEKSYKYIENGHKIKKGTVLYEAVTEQNDGIEYFLLSKSDFKDKLSNIEIDYDKAGYEQFIQFKINKILYWSWITLKDVDYDTTDSFSLPLFRSIEKINQLSGDFNFEFAYITYDNKRKLIIRVLDKSNTYVYYDFSQIPFPFF